MFDSLNQFTVLIILGVLAIIVEIILGAATGFELLIIGIVFVIGGGVGMLTGSMMIAIGTITALILGYVFFGRKMIKQALNVTTSKTNIDSIIGKQGMVVEPINPDKPGQIKHEGEIWRAEADKVIVKGKKVKIISVSGVTLKVTEIA